MYNKQLTAGLTIITLLLSQVSAHFILQYPKSLGFDDDKEGDAPCGGFDVTTNNASDFHVDGDAVALTSTHPQANWFFRATLDKTAAGNWTDLLPAVSESGLGAFCEPALTVPATWAGSLGIVQVIQHGDDGELYQCAALNFVAGKVSSIPSECKNVTGLTASFTSDASLGATAAATAMSSDATASGAMPAKSSSASKSSAVSAHQYASVSSIMLSALAASGLAAVVMGIACV